MQYFLNYSGTLGFCPLKIEITQFPNEFHLNYLTLKTLIKNKEELTLQIQKEPRVDKLQDDCNLFNNSHIHAQLY